MVNFMYQLDGHRMPSDSLNIILDVPVSVFQNEISIWISELVKPIAFPSVGVTIGSVSLENSNPLPIIKL